MIDTVKFYEYLRGKGLDFFAGVPDSLLKNFCACVTDRAAFKDGNFDNIGENVVDANARGATNVVTANEGNAVALVAGHYLSTKKPGVVYMQNSGIGNAVNPLLSLVDKEVYSIPMLLMVGWRGEPGTKDEPQHVKQGKVTKELFEAMGIKTVVLDEEFEQQIDFCTDYMKDEEQPIALIVRKGTFSDYPLPKREEKYELMREKALEMILQQIDAADFVVSTTGKTSREVFEIRERNGQKHEHDFLTVGSMGHTASIALGMSLGTEKNVYCIDGDGSFLMHMGGMAVIPEVARDNFKYILIDNGAHESVGGQPTVGLKINVPEILKGCGFLEIYEARNEAEIAVAVSKMKNQKLAALVIYTKVGSRDDLGRPTISPLENKKKMMGEF